MAFDLGAAGGAEESSPTRLTALLDRLDLVARVYRDRALHFTCDEKISYFPPHGGKLSYRFHYVYVYDEEGRLQDYRTERRRGKSKKPGPPDRAVNLDASGLPSFLLRAYSSILLFEAKVQERYRYRILGPDEVLGRQAVRIAFEPVAEMLDPSVDWFGTAWVDRESHQLLRFEGITAEDHLRKRGFEEGLGREADAGAQAGPGAIQIDHVTTEFSVQEHGLRFPGEVTIRGLRLVARTATGAPGYREQSLYIVRQKYSNYRFYGVQTFQLIREPLE